MKNDSSINKWSVYEQNVQQYRVLCVTVQSFFLTVGTILYTQSNVPSALLIIITATALIHIKYIWFEIVKARHLIIDYYKFQHYTILTPEQLTELKDKYPESRYVHDVEARQEVNSKFFNKPHLKLWRATRFKLDIIVPLLYTIIWISLFLWKNPFITLF